MRISLVGEGRLDIAVLSRLVVDAGFETGETFGLRGKSDIDQKIAKYNVAARFSPWAVLRDLDDDATCAGEVRATLLPSPADQMCFRLAVRQVEAWLLADADRFAAHFSTNWRLPASDVDVLSVPKTVVLEALSRSTSRTTRNVTVRIVNGARVVGPEYTNELVGFVMTRWRPATAAKHSRSLKMARLRLAELAQRTIRL
jgi:hypothetical protein